MSRSGVGTTVFICDISGDWGTEFKFGGAIIDTGELLKGVRIDAARLLVSRFASMVLIYSFQHRDFRVIVIGKVPSTTVLVREVTVICKANRAETAGKFISYSGA